MRKSAPRCILGLLLLAALPITSFAFVSVGVSITIAPPPLPVYVQPPIPAAGYLWTPGYWAWGGNDYYWVPGTWVLAPAPGLLWTPGYWGWVDGAYLWNAGYWGPHVGFYGGVNYGFGYIGTGFAGGEWRGGTFFYNRRVANVGTVHITNVYDRTVINNVTVNRVSFNGGSGGTSARPTAADLTAAHDRHIAATALQVRHEQIARSNPQLRAAANRGRPAIAATARPAQFTGKSIVAARAAGGPVNAQVRSDRPPQASRTAEFGRPTGANAPNSAPQARFDRPVARAPERAESRPPTPHPEKPRPEEHGH